MPRSLLAAAAAAILLCTSAQADTIAIGFIERAGYSYFDHGEPKGLLIEIARGVLTRAGVPFHFEALPQIRLIDAVKNDERQICGLGFFKTPEREGFAVFTKPIYRNRPIGVLINADARERFSRIHSLTELLDTPGLTLGVITGFSYGPYLDGLIGRMTGDKLSASLQVSQLVTVLAAHHIDYMFADPEEYQAVISTAGIGADSLTLLSFPDSPEGNRRYLMCSKSVPPPVIDAINRAIGP